MRCEPRCVKVNGLNPPLQSAGKATHSPHSARFYSFGVQPVSRCDSGHQCNRDVSLLQFHGTRRSRNRAKADSAQPRSTRSHLSCYRGPANVWGEWSSSGNRSQFEWHSSRHRAA